MSIGATNAFSTFATAMTKMVLPAEGGYSNAKHDSGGPTFKGITLATALRNGFSNVRALTDQQIYQIYHKDYWTPGRCGDFLSAGVATAHFDTVVNMGLGGGKKVLVNALNKLNLGASLSQSMSELVRLANSADETQLKQAYMAARNDRYNSIIAHNPALNCFRRGWQNRMTALAKVINSNFSFQNIGNVVTGFFSTIGSTVSSLSSALGFKAGAGQLPNLSGMIDAALLMKKMDEAPKDEEAKKDDKKDSAKGRENEEYVNVDQGGKNHQISLKTDQSSSKDGNKTKTVVVEERNHRQLYQAMNQRSLNGKNTTLEDILAETAQRPAPKAAH